MEEMRPYIQQLHDTPHKTVLAVSGAGTQAVAWLLGVSGASRTILEVVVPYGRLAMRDFLGFEPEQSASADTATALAKRAYERARAQREDDSPVVGLACAAAIATDRTRRGENRAFVAAWDSRRIAIWSLTLDKGLRDRAGEEDVVSRLIIQSLSEMSGLDPDLDLKLTDGDRLEPGHFDRPEPLGELLEGDIRWVVRHPDGSLEAEGDVPGVLLPGSFNPLHVGHREMVETATRAVGVTGAYELSVTNVDKPPLEIGEVERRLSQFGEGDTVVLTRAETFQKKAALFPGRTFVQGWDTTIRLVAPRYYDGEAEMMLALAEMMAGRTKFLVAGRSDGGEFRTLADVDVPAGFAPMFEEIREAEFRRDISSTELRDSQRDEQTVYAFISIDEPLIIISIGRSFPEGLDVYDAVRYSWVISANKARRYNLVLAQYRGEIVGAFRPTEWLPAANAVFSDHEYYNDSSERWGFVGQEAEPEVWRRYVGKRVPDRYRPMGAANPIRYCDPELG